MLPARLAGASSLLLGLLGSRTVRALRASAGSGDAICWEAQQFTRGPRPRYCVLDDPAYDAARFVEELDAAWARDALWDFLLVTRRRRKGPPVLLNVVGGDGGAVAMEHNSEEWQDMIARYRALFPRPPVMTSVAGWLCTTDSEELAVPFDELRTVWYDKNTKPLLLADEHALPLPEAGDAVATRPLKDQQLAFECEDHSLIQSLAKHYREWPQQKGKLSLFLAYWDRPWASDPEFDDHELRAIKAALSTGLFKRVWWGQKDVDTHGLFETAPQGLSWHYVWGRERSMYEAVRGAQLEGKTGVLGAWGARGTATSASADSRELEEFCLGSGGKDLIERRLIAKNEYYSELSKYRFMLAPRGGAVLSPKFTEALLVLTIPITKRYACFDDYKAYGWPIVVVDEWDEITPENLERWWAELSPRLLKARWLATKHGMETLLHGECYDEPPPPPPATTWAKPCSCAKHDECAKTDKPYFSPRFNSHYLADEYGMRSEWLMLGVNQAKDITESAWTHHVRALEKAHTTSLQGIGAVKVIERLTGKVSQSQRDAFAINAAHPSTRRFDKLLVVIHFHKAGGTSMNDIIADSGLLGLTNQRDQREMRGQTFNVDNDWDLRHSTAFADPALYTGLYDAGVDFIAFENSFVPLEALDEVRPHIHLVASMRDPWRRWASTYEREIQKGCFKGTRHHRAHYVPCMEGQRAVTCLDRPLHCRNITSPDPGELLRVVHPSVLHPNLYIKHINSRLDAEVAIRQPVTYDELSNAKRVLGMVDLITTLEQEPQAREVALQTFLRSSQTSDRRESNNALRDSEGRLTDIGARVVGPGAKSAPGRAKERFDALSTADYELYEYAAELAAAHAASALSGEPKQYGAGRSTNVRQALAALVARKSLRAGRFTSDDKSQI